MIKHFDVWPSNVNKNDLFDQQKIFIIYLMGLIPDNNNWSTQVEYLNKLEKIKKIKIDEIKLEQTDIDLAKMQNRDLEELRRERLKDEKKKQTTELKETYGIKEEREEIHVEGIPDVKDAKPQEKMLWDLLHGKGLVKEKAEK